MHTISRPCARTRSPELAFADFGFRVQATLTLSGTPMTAWRFSQSYIDKGTATLFLTTFHVFLSFTGGGGAVLYVVTMRAGC